MSYLVVSSLADMPVTVARHGARDLLTLINADSVVPRPETIAEERHLFLGFNDIVTPIEGLSPPMENHVRDLIAFGSRWDRDRPLVVHCFAGISRSTAAAYILAISLNPALEEMALARELRARAPSATPNARLVGFADEILGRKGRMVEAIRSIGRGADAFSGTPFVLPLELQLSL
ncbi:tyrosine protein phosphatase [Fulvimarina sp. 2208YS6-2-32]|uniref:Tyrosine protein phosphatase n=1 Tax=Fulvimarina uroteuthidis TaxID=3098149 RepID=A0ABU5I5W9_9HYPH|nr:tyrosine protein phosphatase [Fulvimarina sp. 2208YS6-2-32]MDY8109551.1 tyrosine protein phosphatase [Fulvimarina sp. 2208YS6-2-32]